MAGVESAKALARVTSMDRYSTFAAGSLSAAGTAHGTTAAAAAATSGGGGGGGAAVTLSRNASLERGAALPSGSGAAAGSGLGKSVGSGLKSVGEAECLLLGCGGMTDVSLLLRSLLLWFLAMTFCESAAAQMLHLFPLVVASTVFRGNPRR